MADDSPGKVQALRAIFAEKNTPVMGMMPPHGHVFWRTPEQNCNGSKDLLKPKMTAADQDGHRNRNEHPMAIKPPVGPKPSHLVQPQQKTLSSEKVSGDRYCNRTSEESSQIAKRKAFGEAIASFMFTVSNKENSESPPIPKPRTSLVEKQLEIVNLSRTRADIDLDNYICKSSCQVRKKDLPSLEQLGPAPPKPSRPPQQLMSKTVSSLHTQRPPQRPCYPCPPRPQTPPPLPPDKKYSFRQELEELYEDTIEEGRKRPIFIMPEDEELYNDASEENFETDPKTLSYLEYRAAHSSSEELYQDASEFEPEEFYEVMPCDEIQEEYSSPLYSNNKKEVEKVKRDEKKLRQEQKEKDKKDKVMEKLKKKFGITGDEIPIDDGLVKCDSRGGRGDLSVKRGETVLILRMEGNPSGRWLVKNEKGKIGYVELTNIEVDPISVKSVMSVRGLSGMDGEELYCEAKSKEAV